MRKLSPYSDQLIDQLDAQYPARCRLPDESEREHERYSGKVELIEELRARIERDSLS